MKKIAGFGLLIIVVVVGSIGAFHFWGKHRDAELHKIAEARVRADLAKALDVFKSQGLIPTIDHCDRVEPLSFGSKIYWVSSGVTAGFYNQINPITDNGEVVGISLDVHRNNLYLVQEGYIMKNIRIWVRVTARNPRDEDYYSYPAEDIAVTGAYVPVS